MITASHDSPNGSITLQVWWIQVITVDPHLSN